jgi:hypothetical protein
MNPIPFAKTIGAHFVAAWLAVAAVACESPEVVDVCNDLPQCYRDAAADGIRRDTPLPPDSVVADSGPSRSALCGTVGCFPGNPSACGPTPVPDAAFSSLRQQDDGSGPSNDAPVTDATPDAGADAEDAPGSTDAGGDVCNDGPDDASSDADVSVDVSEPPDATEDTVSEPEPDASEDASADADGGTPPPDSGTSDSGGRTDVTGDIGTSDEPRIVQSCYIRPAGTGVVTECAPVGPGAEGTACNDSHECGALLACVEVDQKAVCRRVWCALPPDCLKGTYYQEALLRVNGATRSDLAVPVCLPTDNCTLLASPNPCPAGKVCAVVGSEGETTCLEPGSAKVNEPCDETSRCSEGLLCSKFSNQCVKICHVDAGPIDCPTGTCQGGNRSLPDGFGICVGQTDGG